eukprot:SM000168S02635  [mRNA]  locus=s168:306773:307716:- [translate_table: standard]
MRVAAASAGLLTNLEALHVLRDAAPSVLGPDATAAAQAQARTCRSPQAGYQTHASVTAAVAELKKLGLTKAEILQIVNLRPTTAVEIHLIVEDCEERLSTIQAERLLGAVAELLPGPPAAEGAA